MVDANGAAVDGATMRKEWEKIKARQNVAKAQYDTSSATPYTDGETTAEASYVSFDTNLSFPATPAIGTAHFIGPVRP